MSTAAANHSWPDHSGLVRAYGQAPETGFGPDTIDVEVAEWARGLHLARDELGCTFFDFLTSVDERDAGFCLYAHVARPGPGHVDHLLLRTRLDPEHPVVDCVCGVYVGAAWHERETHEMFGIEFTGHQPMPGLLLPDGFSGHPLRKDFVLASRVVKPWPGAKEPGESDRDAAPSRRRTRPPGVPDPADWGPA